MIKKVLLITVLLFLTACSSLKVQSDYDPKFNFSSLKSYEIIYREDKNNSLVNNRIEHAIFQELAQKGFHKVKSKQDSKNTDFYIIFHTQVSSKTDIFTDYSYMHVSPYTVSAHYIPTTRVYNYDEGKLVVDFVDVKTNELIWQGIATDRLNSLDTPKEKTEYINKVLKELLKTFDERVIQKK
jgi:hypothetical protein